MKTMEMPEAGLAQEIPSKIRYCLYARKSTEQEDKQALSIESQVREKTKIKDIDIRNYAKHILRKRSVYEKREVLSHLRSKLVLKDKKLLIRL